MSIKLTQEEFLNRCNEKHDFKFNYDKTYYLSRKQKVIITCPIHGDFEQIAEVHMLGHGCPQCTKEKRKLDKTKSTKEFISDCEKYYGVDTYSYNKVNYTHSQQKVIITCPIHGDFEQRPSDFLRGFGCTLCSGSKSKGEQIIHNWLIENNILFKSQYTFYSNTIFRNSNKVIVDFLVKFNNFWYIIEYNGKQHYDYIPYFHETYEDFEKQENRDNLLSFICQKQCDEVCLINIPFEYSNTQIVEKLQDIFYSKNKYTIFTDGAYSSLRDSMGCAFIVLKDDEIIFEYSRNFGSGTSQRAELISAIESLYFLNIPSEIELISDSQYLVNTMTKNWQRKVNNDLWEDLDKLNKKHKITWCWTKGHANNEINNRCDRLAVEASQKEVNYELQKQ